MCDKSSTILAVLLLAALPLLAEPNDDDGERKAGKQGEQNEQMLDHFQDWWQGIRNRLGAELQNAAPLNQSCTLVFTVGEAAKRVVVSTATQRYHFHLRTRNEEENSEVNLEGMLMPREKNKSFLLSCMISLNVEQEDKELELELNGSTILGNGETRVLGEMNGEKVTVMLTVIPEAEK